MHSTLRDINLRIEQYAKEKEECIKLIEYQSWLTGMYVSYSISCNFNKHAKYPKNPIQIDTKDTKQMAKVTGKSEEELKQEEIYMALMIRKANANIAKARKERESLIQEKQGS